MNGLTIAGQEIRIDDAERFSLNDLHRAGGGESRHRPSVWLANQQTKELVFELDAEAGIPALAIQHGGTRSGSFACRELALAFSAWISPRFHLAVLRAADSVMSGKRQLSQDVTAALRDPATLRSLLLDQADSNLRLQHEADHLQEVVDRQAPRAAAFDRMADSRGALSLRAAAKVLGLQPNQFNGWLSSLNWIYRAADSGGWMGAAQCCNSGHLEHRLYLPENSHRHRVQVLVTMGGIARLSQLLEAASMPTALNPTPAMSVRQPRRSSHV